MTLLEMIAAAATKYEFRARGPIEDPAAYREALIVHVRGRDFAASHELRVGRPQAEWTTDDVRTFREMCAALPQPRSDALPFAAIPLVETGRFNGPLRDDMVIGMADVMLNWFSKERRRDPQREFTPMIDLLLMDGRTLATQVLREGRVRVLKTLAQNLPLYGYVIGMDMFLHLVDSTNTHAEKTEAFLAHVGTRDTRLARVRPYRRTPTGIVFTDPPPEDLDLRGKDAQDPYASIFVSVPTPTTTQ